MSLRVVLAFLIAGVVVVLPGRADAATKADGTGGTSYTSSTHGGTAAQAQASQGASVPTATAPSTTAVPGSTTVPGTTAAPVAPATVDPTTRLAAAPAGAPAAVTALIAAGNQIATLPYKYGGGHGSFVDTAYDCSGSVSFALHGAGLLAATLDSTELSTWGRSGAGRWITIYANKTHTYLVVAGIRFDTSGQKAAGGTRWQAALRSNKGFKVRHPAGF